MHIVSDDPTVQETSAPLIPSNQTLPEITVKAIILGIIVTAILGASNAYLALKLGQTIAASIPAAVIAMGVLRFFKSHNVLEINIVQTAASAGEGVAAAVSFVLPALIIMGYWQHFNYFGTAILTILGGILGVLFSIPLRRVMLNYPTLRFPEGTAIGNVLKASASGTAKMKHLIQGGLAGSIIAFMQTGFKVFSDNMQLWFQKGQSLFGMGLGFSPALLAAGYIVGAQACMGMFVGLALVWLIGMPILSHVFGIGTGSSPYDLVMNLWSHHIRFIGVGTMLLGGAWTLVSLLKPIIQGIITSFSSFKQVGTVGKLPRVERDIPMKYVVWGIFAFTIFSFLCLSHFLRFDSYNLSTGTRVAISAVGAIYILVGGFFISSVCAYFSGLVGMTNNPLSGLMLGCILIAGLLLLPVISEVIAHHPDSVTDAVSLVIIITTVVAIATSISGENLQDLKAGKMVGATPWKQQVMLVLGVIVAALVVGPVLELLFQAYGLGGVFPRTGMDPTQMLPAPQAGLMTAVAQGVFGHKLPWTEILTGAAIAFVAIIIDEQLKRKGLRLPILAIGIGIYLPPEIVIPVVIGGFINFAAKAATKRRANQEQAVTRQAFENATLIACGMVAGAALMGVILAIPFVIKGSTDALSIVSASFTPIANILGLVVTVFLCIWLYKVSVSTKKAS